MQKRMIKYLYVVVTLAILSACGQKKASDEIRVIRTENSDKVDNTSKTPQRMPVSDVKTTFTFRGQEYNSSVVRRPDDSLPMVKDEDGARYVDNSVTLRLMRGNNVVVDKRFTKESFASVVKADFMRHAMLDGLVFNRVTSNGIVYSASVAYPQSDLYVPIIITIGADGSMSIAQDDTLDEQPETDEGRSAE